MGAELSLKESRELIELCKRGKLYAIKDWISAGRSIRLAPDSKKSILSLAVRTGFHSLVEFIAPHETREAKNRGLSDAVLLNRLDLVELLVACGAEIKVVPVSAVFHFRYPRIMRFFIKNGGGEDTNKFQEYADAALRKFAHDGNLERVKLLMAAGADSRSVGPKLKPDQSGIEKKKAQNDTTAVLEACHQETPDVLRILKPNPNRDNLTALLNRASALSRDAIVKYLLDIGAKPNDKANGASTAMDNCLAHLPSSSSPREVRWLVQPKLETVAELIRYGAIWRPDDPRQMEPIRQTLCRNHPSVTILLVQLFVETKCCSPETLQLLFGTPSMKEHLRNDEKMLLNLGVELRTLSEKAEEANRRAFDLAGRYDRERLYEEIWSQPMTVVAKNYQLSDVRLGKICAQLNIPRPGRGYWAKKRAGKPVEPPPPLPPLLLQ